MSGLIAAIIGIIGHRAATIRREVDERTAELAESRRQLASMLDTLRRHDIHAWRQRFLEDLAAARTTPGAVAGNLQRGA